VSSWRIVRVSQTCRYLIAIVNGPGIEAVKIDVDMMNHIGLNRCETGRVTKTSSFQVSSAFLTLHLISTLNGFFSLNLLVFRIHFSATDDP